MSEKEEKNINYYDKIVNWPKHHKIISVVIIIFFVLGSLFTFTNDFFNLRDRLVMKSNVNGSSLTPLNNNNIENQTLVGKDLPPEFVKENPILIKLTYKPPKINQEDLCNVDDESCVGLYIKIGQDDNFLYFDHPSCKSYNVIGYHYDSGNNGEKMISDWQIEEKRTCNWIGLPRSSILNMVNLSSSTSTIKTIPNYKIID